MNTITAILEPDADGTLHLPLPADLRGGKIEVTATLRPVNGSATETPHATPEMLRARREALQQLRDAGGLKDVISDPVAWQREQREDRPQPGRE